MKLDIQAKLNQKGMSRYELAKRIGVTYPTIDSIYKGKSTSIKLEILDAICSELNCTPNEILVSENPKTQRLMKYTRAGRHEIRKIRISDDQLNKVVVTTLSKNPNSLFIDKQNKTIVAQVKKSDTF